MGYEKGSSSKGDKDDDIFDEDDEDEYEDDNEGNRLLEFMFGNVDGSGDLDIDYLDEDAKEHLAALAGKLGSSLADINLSVKSSRTSIDAAEQDYDEKAEDAVDYEDIDEQYEGPEVQAVTEEDYLLPKVNYVSTKGSTATSMSVFDDENYDEDEDEPKKELEAAGNNDGPQAVILSDDQENSNAKDLKKVSPGDGQNIAAVEAETLDRLSHSQDEQHNMEEPLVASSTPLPVLCVEDGEVILRFSEIFAIQEPLRKAEKRDHWYSVPKDKYKIMDVSDFVEEDEESYLKGSSQLIYCTRTTSLIQDDGLEFTNNELGITEFQIVEAAETLSREVNDRKDSCLSAVPMNEDETFDFSTEWLKSSSLEYYPLDQQDWENRVIWDNSPSSESGCDSFDMPEPVSDHFDCKPSNPANDPQNIQLEIEKGQGKNLSCYWNSSVEPFISGKSPMVPLFSEEGCCHPQLLRLESRMEMVNANLSDGRRDSGTCETDAIRRFNKLTLRNNDIMEGSWVEKIIWDPHQSVQKPKLILDLQDDQMLFEILDNKDGEHLQLHAGAMLVARSVNPSGGDTNEVHNHGSQPGARFNIANDKFYSNRKSTHQLKSHSKKRTAQSVKVLHSIPATKLQTMKTKLSNKDIANFHRPKSIWYPHDNEVALKEQGKLLTRGPMKIILKSLGGKGSKFHVDAEETISSIKAKATKKLDYKPSEPVRIIYSGKELEENKSLAEQNVRPNSLLHLVRSQIHLLPKAQKLPNENKSLRPPGAFKKKADLSAKDGHVFLMEYCEERPLLLGNLGMGARLCTYYQKSTPSDQTGTLLRSSTDTLGTVLTLDPSDKSPFLGDIKPGCSQSCLETNMYRAPIYPHKVPSTDYLLVRSAKGKLSIRRIDRINVVGQQEPHMEVMSPVSKGVQIYNMNRLLVYIYREFRALQKRGLLPSVLANELSAQFPNVPDAALKKRLKHFCDFQRGSWVMRRNFRLPLEEELRRMVTPENVCAYESMLAGLYRLKRLGISMTHPAGISSAMNQLPDEAIALAAASHIERELQITPWNLSSNFVACTNQGRENIERLEITGVGDPSGRGLGFSYVRTTPKAPVNATTKKKVAVPRGGPTVTGTDADLRRLSMEAAREILVKFDVPEDQIAKLTRWHRIAMIRKLSSEQAASGVKVDPSTISKYARGQRMSYLQLQQQTREKCQEIWDRQVQNLSAFDGEELESDIEANSDLDSFAGDLENLLDAEECEDGNEGKNNSIHDNLVGVKGLKMRRRPSQAQAEEQIEDEAAEAAELCKMLMDDDDAELKKTMKAKSQEMPLAAQPPLSHGMKNKGGLRKTNAIVKPIAVVSQPAYSSQVNDLDHLSEVDLFSNGSKLPGKLKQMKGESVKVKILGDGIDQQLKPKKSARDTFVCGACGQLGHMKTNKHCPKYREDLGTLIGSKDSEKLAGKSNVTDDTPMPQQKMKKIITKGGNKIAVVEAAEDDSKSASKAKVLKVKCGLADKPPEKVTPSTSQISDRPVTSDTETVNKSGVKVNKITFSNKMKSDTAAESSKPSVVIRPPMETDINQPRKKIIIKRTKEVIDLDRISQEGNIDVESRKMKRIEDLSGFNSSRMNTKEERVFWEEEGRRRNLEWQRQGWPGLETLNVEGRETVDEIRKYEEDIREERREEEEKRRKEKKNKKKTFEPRDGSLEEPWTRKNDRRGERGAKRKPIMELGGRYGAELGPPLKRRRGGEVILSNILESIVESLKGNYNVSYLFLKPVAKKDAPDYLRIIERPMDLSKIRDKVRNLEYKDREAFRHDVWQITYNAHKYNDKRNPDIPPLADQLLEICDVLLHQNDPGLTEAEFDIQNS